ncbi:terminase large subunit [Bertelyvirus sp.]|nr:putative terminase large subunit [Caulobacter phage C2]WGN97366.1 putative terminase large subunit [Bertelyvirus sp.]WGN97904.1 terminase large subunit [Bertelyvirus sp.]
MTSASALGLDFSKPPISPYPHEERSKRREGVRRMRKLSEDVRYFVDRGLEPDPTIAQVANAITGVADPRMQVNLLDQIADKIQHEHLEKLSALAKNDFSAFCEVISPEEPPESPWHIWLTNFLQEVEMSPDLNKVVLNVPPGHAKPLADTTPVLMGDGAYKLLRDIKVGDQVWTHAQRARPVTAIHDQGKLATVWVETTAGRRVQAALDHPFLVKLGEREDGSPIAEWINAGDLRPGMDLVVAAHTPPRLVHHRYDGDHTDYDAFLHRARMLGYMAIGGALHWQKSKTQVTPSPDFRLSTHKRPLMKAILTLVKKDLGHHMSVCKVSSQNTFVARLGVKAFRDLNAGDWFTYEPEKRRAPPAIFTASREEIAAFVGAAFTLRGEVIRRLKGKNLRLYHRSQDLLSDIQKLCATLGAFSSLDRGDPDFGGRPCLNLDFGAVEALQAAGVTFDAETDADLAAQPPKVLGAAFDPGLDTVVSVMPGKKASCLCLTVEEDHSFTAETLVVKNSTYASRLFVAWRLGRDPNQRIIGGGHSQNFVENEFSSKIRDIVESPEYQKVFPAVVIDHKTNAKQQWKLAGYKGQYVARGVGQGIHGFRATFICVDDPYSKIEDANSPVHRRKVEQWFDADIGSRALPGCKTFLIMTRFHGEDLTNHLEEMNKVLPADAQWKIVTVPAICFDEDTDLLGRKVGELLWDYYPLSYFVDKKVQFGFLGFALTYQQVSSAANPDNIASKFNFYDYLPHESPEALARAPKDQFGRPQPDLSDFYRRTIVSVDTAAKTTERADYTVVQVWREDFKGNHYLVHQDRRKVEFNDLIAMIEGPALKYRADQILVEDKGSGTQYLQNRGATDSQKRQAPAPLVAVNPGVAGKEFRFDGVTPMITAGEVWLPKNAPWIEQLLVEVGQFPDSAHDDQVDALSQYLNHAKKNRTRYGSRKITKHT